jgi:hypothetical protein
MTTPEDTTKAAGGSPLERGVGRLTDEATDADGPRGSYGCACMDRDSVQCAAIRYGMDHYGEACTCLCHQWSDDDDYDY